jgi:hypothetical protein
MGREETGVRSAAPALEATAGVDAATSSSSSTIVIGTRRHVGFGAEDRAAVRRGRRGASTRTSAPYKVEKRVYAPCKAHAWGL